MFVFSHDVERAVPVPGLCSSSPAPSAWYRRVTPFPADPESYVRLKRAFDLAAVLILLPLALPVTVLCCILIVLDSPGPPIFTQLRTGRGGIRFRMLKLRTMVADAEARKDNLHQLSQLAWPDFKIAADPRVTRVGRILRKTSLDELPQLLNVLLGDMSLVGPRPTSFSSSTYRAWQTARLDVQPGLSGLWQVEGRNQLPFDERCRLDIAYARHRSLALDFLILLRTVPRVLSGRGAS